MSLLSGGPVVIQVGDALVAEGHVVNPLPLKRDRIIGRIVNDYSVTITMPISGVIYTAAALAPPLDKQGKPVA